MSGFTTAAVTPVTPAVAWLLRIGVAMCFIGHGAFGLLQKREWLAFFAPFGIGETVGLQLMPVVGTADIALGLAVLCGAPRAFILYGACWCVFTAALRPFTALSAGEFFERAGNYGVPIALLVWTSGQSWWSRIETRHMPADRAALVRTVCLWTTAVLLFGHGWLALESKPLLIHHLSLVGAGRGVRLMGLFEIALAVACVARPSTALFVSIAMWKLATESLFVFAGAPVWEFIERGGSYVAPIAAAMLTAPRRIVVPIGTAPLSAAAALAMMVAATAQLSAQAPGSLTPELVAELRSGGFVVACRHAITSHDREDRMPVNFDDPSTQRVLSAAGEQQAIDLGGSLAALEIRFGAVLASPFQRTRRSAESMAGQVRVAEALSSMARGRDAELGALLYGPVDAGGNRLVVTHQGLLYRVFRSIKQGSIREGDCLVVRPTDQGGEVVALVTPADWARAAQR